MQQGAPLRSTRLALVYIACLALISSAMAGGLAVQPVRLFMDPGRTTESIQLRNESGKPLPLQIRAFEWRQDEQGRDRYQPTSELIVFPRMMTLEPDEQRIVRIGVRGMAPEGEHTYRIYLEELPEPESAPVEGLKTLLRIGVPVFRRPASIDVAGEVTGLHLDDCLVGFNVANRGNAHFMMQRIIVTAFDRVGRELTTAELPGWYLLARKERSFSHELPAEFCGETRRLKVQVISDHASFEEVADVPF
jgi:fimbrial chaperone protein